MKTYFNKKTIKNMLLGIFILMVSFSYFISPKKVNAQLSTIDAGNLVQNTLSALSSAASAASDYSSELKEYVLDPLASGLAKMVIRQMTNSIVNWINSGFEGSPSFLENPGAFFLDVADQITGDFIAKTGALQDLCSPFSIDIRIALAFKYRPRTQERYSCTLGTIIKNSKNAAENASINGFTAGDFRQGGWPAFVSLTTEPQNNIYGAYLMAESELSWRVANAQAGQKEEIAAGRGFLSWRDPECMKQVRADKKRVRESGTRTQRDEFLDTTVEVEENQGPDTYNTTRAVKTELDCPVKTPGTVIVNSLEANVNGPLHELQLADELGEIVNALFAQLATQILQKGLSSVSQRDSSGSSYLDQTVADLNNEANPQVQTIKNNLTRDVDAYKKNSVEYKQIRDEALAVILDVKSSYDAAKACFNTKLQSGELRLSNDVQTAQLAISEIDSTLLNKINPKAVSLLQLAQEADRYLKTLEEIQAEASRATTLNELNTPSQKYSQLASSRGLIGPTEIQKAKDDLAAVKTEASALKQDSLRKQQLCQTL